MVGVRGVKHQLSLQSGWSLGRLTRRMTSTDPQRPGVPNTQKAPNPEGWGAFLRPLVEALTQLFDTHKRQ